MAAKRRAEAIDAAAADRACRFIGHLRHATGRWAGVPFDLRPWQQTIVRRLFGTLWPDGRRQYRRCHLEVPRKNGKSALGAAIALYLLLADNEPGAEVYSAATDREQASIVFTIAANMVRQSPVLRRRCRIIDSQKRIVVPATASVYRALSADAASKHGYNAHGIIFDELHAQPNRELWDVMATSMGARDQPLLLDITTAGYDRNSICWEEHEYARQLLEGAIPPDPTYLPVIYAAPEDADWRDESVWRAANPALGDFRSIDEMRALAKKAEQVPALQNTFRRLYLDQWTQQESRWLDIAAWDATAGLVVPEHLAGRSCYAGLDLASTTDIAALVLVFPPDDAAGVYRVLSHFWIPGANVREKGLQDRVPYEAWVRQGLVTATEGNVIHYGAIRAKVRELAQIHNIREIAFDRWGATQISQDLTDDGLTMVPFGQGFRDMSPPTKELLNLVLDQRLRHGGNPVLRWMADNMAVLTDPAGNLKPDKSKRTRRIDGMVALIMALDRAVRHADEGPSVYETRGLLSI